MLRERIGDLCVGRWESILGSLGVASNFLSNRHGPCPACGGKDRYRFDNKEGRGSWFCSHCGAGDGFGLLRKLNGWSFSQAAREVERVLGMSTQDSPHQDFSEEEKRAARRRVYRESSPIEYGDLAWQYLKNRCGVSELPVDIRLHPGMKLDGVRYPVMLAIVRMSDGAPSTMHRTWLDGSGGKAPGNAKKVMPGTIKGGSVRLGPIKECIGIAEGIETALSASVMFNMPVWSAISASNLQQWEPPEGISSVVIFGDNDENFVGQKAAYELAQSLTGRGLKVEVRVPARVGTDWADVWAEERGM